MGPSRFQSEQSGGSDGLFVGLGYRPEIADQRDLQLGLDAGREKLRRVFSRVGAALPEHLLRNGKLPDDVDLRRLLLREPNFKPVIDRKHPERSVLPLKNFTDPRLQNIWPVEDQGQINSCTAHAVIGLVEFLVRRQLKQSIDLSRLFLYNTTRHLLGWPSDAGAYIRDTIKSMTIFGVPPEDYWPYEVTHFDAAPDAFLYSYASSFKALTYMRLDANFPYPSKEWNKKDSLKHTVPPPEPPPGSPVGIAQALPG
jgi:hypothetical protein